MKLFSSRQEKKRAKRRAKYLQVRDDVLESAQASYKAEPERNGPLNASGIKKNHAEKKRSAIRESYQADSEKKQTAERERYQAETVR